MLAAPGRIAPSRARSITTIAHLKYISQYDIYNCHFPLCCSPVRHNTSAIAISSDDVVAYLVSTVNPPFSGLR